MGQNTIAIIWDFDKTLTSGYMQEPIFKKYNIESSEFWAEVNALPAIYEEQGIKVNKDTVYLNHLITCVEQGIFPGLNNEVLVELGAELEFYPGIPQIFTDLKEIVSNDADYAKFGINVEHYIVSTGISAMIRGSKIHNHIDGIWGCEFIESPVRSNLDIKLSKNGACSEKSIRQIGYIIDNTSKTRAIFEINKRSNKFDYIDVNSKIEQTDRRVPFENMIYIADGPSDIPVFSILKQNKGRTFAIYPKGDKQAFHQVDQLRRDDRIDAYAEANYSEGEQAYMWLMERECPNRRGI